MGNLRRPLQVLTRPPRVGIKVEELGVSSVRCEIECASDVVDG